MTTRNVYQRKLAVMKRCGEIKPDKVHPHHKFEYNSIQQISNRMREFAADEGLDVSVDFDDGHVRVVLTNVDLPEEQITKFYPVSDGDKGLAYSTKYPLIRLFLIGDGEENDEAEMANKTSPTSPRRAPTPTTEHLPAAALVSGERNFQEGDPCPTCMEIRETTGADVYVGRFKVAKGGPHVGQLQCTGKVEGAFANHLAPTAAFNDPTDIPF